LRTGAYCELRELGLSDADKGSLLADMRQHSIEVVEPYRAHLWMISEAAEKGKIQGRPSHRLRRT
jgi:hypothetical protein